MLKLSSYTNPKVEVPGPKKIMMENGIRVEDYAGKGKSETMSSRKYTEPRREEFFPSTRYEKDAPKSAQKFNEEKMSNRLS